MTLVATVSSPVPRWRRMSTAMSAMWSRPMVDRAMQARAVAGQLQVAALPLEHGCAQMLLQQLDLPADRRLGQGQLLAGAGEIEVPAGRLEHHQAVDRRQPAPQLGHDLSSSINENYPCLAWTTLQGIMRPRHGLGKPERVGAGQSLEGFRRSGG